MTGNKLDKRIWSGNSLTIESYAIDFICRDVRVPDKYLKIKSPDYGRMNRYLFPDRLEEGLIKSRPNRFIMEVAADGALCRCHCPVTGRIGSIGFEDIPCLLSRGGEGRKTPYTVEAISLDPPDKRKKRWVGINQGRVNDYVAFFLRENAFVKMYPSVETLDREVKLGNSRIDFLVNGRDYLEVKPPLEDLPCEGHPNYMGHSNTPVSPDRLIKHFGDTSDAIKDGSRSRFLLCFMYDAPPFKKTPTDAQGRRIAAAVREAQARGVENWQANFDIDADGVSLRDNFKLQMSE
jgi:sugar fermentation stimulation protein A